MNDMKKPLLLIVLMICLIACEKDDTSVVNDENVLLLKSLSSKLGNEPYFLRDTLIYSADSNLIKRMDQYGRHGQSGNWTYKANLYQFEYKNSLLDKVFVKAFQFQNEDMTEVLEQEIATEDNLLYSCIYEQEKLTEIQTKEQQVTSGDQTYTEKYQVKFVFDGKKISSIEVYRNNNNQGFEHQFKYDLIYEGDNVKTVNQFEVNAFGEEQLKLSLSFDYDDKVNPFYQLYAKNNIFLSIYLLNYNFNTWPGYSFVSCFSKHNIVKEYMLNENYFNDYNLTYNESNYPVTFISDIDDSDWILNY